VDAVKSYQGHEVNGSASCSGHIMHRYPGNRRLGGEGSKAGLDVLVKRKSFMPL